MTTLLQAESRPLYSWWWDSHIRPKNSKLVQENLTANMDVNIKAMIELLEEDADSFARRAEMYYNRRPVLMKLVEEFYRAYRALAERYDHATGALRQARWTIAEAFPNQVPLALGDDSPASFASEMDPCTPEEKEATALQYQQCLETISSLQHKITCAQEEVQRLNELLRDSETRNLILQDEVLKIKEDNKSLNELKLSSAVSIKDMTENLEKLSEKNTFLENSLSDVHDELEGWKARSERFEELCQLLENDTSDLIKEKERFEDWCQLLENDTADLIKEKDILVSQGEITRQRLEVLEKRYSELEEKYSALEKEQSTLRKVEELHVSLDGEKQEHASYIQMSETDLDCCIDLAVGKGKKIVTAPTEKGTERHQVGAAKKQRSKYPNSDILVEKELGIGKLEISRTFSGPRREVNKSKILERLNSDEQKLRNLQITMHDLKRKLETTEQSKKSSKAAVEHVTMKGQLEEAVEVILQLFDRNRKLMKSIEDRSFTAETKSAMESEDGGKVRRRMISEHARRISKKIGRMLSEVQKIQLAFLKLEENGKEGRRRTGMTEMKQRVLVPDNLYCGASTSQRRKKSGCCACVQPATRGGD